MTMPNFLIIGAAKSGTTSLYYYLKQHPQIYASPVKEPSFFAFEGEEPTLCGPDNQRAPVIRGLTTNLKTYQSLFDGVSSETAVGEASTWHLYSPKAPERIHHYIPDVKLIAILRHPVERAYSGFLHRVRDGLEPISDFAQALQAEENRIQNNWGLIWRYTHTGFYYAQLKRYFDLFDPGQIKVCLYRDYRSNPVNFCKDIFRFLDIDDTFVPDTSIKFNVSGVPKSKKLHSFLAGRNLIKDVLKPLLPFKWRKRIVIGLQSSNLVKPPLSPQVRQQLAEVYREDISKLQDLIRQDLSEWLE